MTSAELHGGWLRRRPILRGIRPRLSPLGPQARADKVRLGLRLPTELIMRFVWVVGAQGNHRLHGYDGDTGDVVFAGGGANELMTGDRKWNSGIVARGSIYVANDNKVYKFNVPGGAPTPIPMPTVTPPVIPTPTSASKPTPAPTSNPSVTPTPTVPPTPTATPTPIGSVTPSPTATPTATPRVTPRDTAQ